jgi:hypothetical protein
LTCPERRTRTVPILAIAIAAGVIASAVSGTAQAPPAGPAPAGEIDLASVEMGGRVEWVTEEIRGDGSAANVIAHTAHYGWLGAWAFPQDIVFSFFSRQSALVAGVEVNPTSEANLASAKDVEIWTSVQSPTEGFTRVAAATLENKNVLQPLKFAPVEAKFVQLRILSSYAPNQRAVLSRVRILEGHKDGYTSILVRNPALAALTKGILPTPPVDAPGKLPPPGVAPTCSAPVPQAKSRFPQSQHVLLVEGYQGTQRAYVNNPYDLKEKNLSEPAVGGTTLRLISPDVLAPALLISEPLVDTVVLGQICDIGGRMSKEFKQALMTWVAAGHKLVIQDSDSCGQSPDYSFLPYPFKTVNPGSNGARGLAGILEDSTLVSSNKRDQSFINMPLWKDGPNDLGDTNVVIESDARWCGVMWSKNKLQKSGFGLAYAHFGRGLIIYDGFDFDQAATAQYRKLVAQELTQPFDPDYLSCSNPLGGFTITTGSDLKSQLMTPGTTYTYPLSILGNFGYSGRVTLEASISPPDAAVTAKLASTIADLTTVDEASTTLTVAAGAGASVKGKTVTVRGRDAAGKVNLACLQLPERTTGGLTVVSGLRKDKKPTKNLEIILDASGSMKALLGKKTRWATALDVLADVVGKLPADYSVGLRTYGHRMPSTSPKTCTDTELVAPVAPLDRVRLMTVARQLRPRGETPLVYSILQTPDDLKAAGGGTVILITDGEESCKGDILAAAKTLKDSGLNLSLNIVGFTLKSAQAQAALGGLAEAMGGRYYAADSGAALGRALLLAAVDQLPYRILDAKGVEVDKGTAGVNGKHELLPGDYTVVVSAGDESLKVPVMLALRRDVSITVGIKDDKLVVEK